MMGKKTFLAVAALLLAASAGAPRIAQGLPPAAASTYLVYTGGLLGQLEPCG